MKVQYNGLHYAETPYKDGYVCASCEDTSIKEDCPFVEGSEEHSEWCMGFNDFNYFWSMR